MPSLSPLIKGYLPVRLKLPNREADEDENFFFVREHKGTKSEQSESSSKAGCTLFVANSPVVPGITTKILLKSIFGRYADISRVTVVDNPRNANNQQEENIGCWSSIAKHPTFLPPIHSEGKYAHVAFESPNGMKKAMKALHEVMRKKGDDGIPGLVLERLEIQTLSDETNRQYRESLRKAREHDDSEEDDDDSDEEEEREKKTGILAVAERYRASCNFMSRSELLKECNAVMQAYEDAEEEKRRAQEVVRSQPDDDGFVTVSYSTAVGSKTDLEESITATTPSRRKGNKRSRKKKEGVGNTELQDFYRFQRRDNKKRTLEDLRNQFEEDLKKVKRMKEDRQYRPF
jgi:ribosomal RNA-processing protein 7